MAFLDEVLRGLEQPDVLLNLSTEEVDTEVDEAVRLYYELLEFSERIAANDMNRQSMFNNTAQRYLQRIQGIETGIATARLGMTGGTAVVNSETAKGTQQGSEVTVSPANDTLKESVSDQECEGAVGGISETVNDVGAEASEVLDESKLLVHASRVPMFEGGRYIFPPLLHTRLTRYLQEREMSTKVRTLRKHLAGSILFGKDENWALVDFYDHVVESSWRPFDDDLDSLLDGANWPQTSGRLAIAAADQICEIETDSEGVEAVNSTDDANCKSPVTEPIEFMPFADRITVEGVQEEPANVPITPENEELTAADTPDILTLAIEPEVITQEIAQLKEPANEEPKPAMPAAASLSFPRNMDQAIDVALMDYHNLPAELPVAVHRYPLCQHCGIAGHHIIRCAHFLAMSIDRRIERVAALNLCQTCLNRHRGLCNRAHCPRCKAAHNSLLCKAPRE